MYSQTADKLVRIPALLYGLFLLGVATAGFCGFATILGVFETTTFHNLIHIFLGVLLVLSSIYSARNTRLVGAFLAALYLLTGILGWLDVLETNQALLRALVETTALGTYLRVISGVGIVTLLWFTSSARSYIND